MLTRIAMAEEVFLGYRESATQAGDSGTLESIEHIEQLRRALHDCISSLLQRGGGSNGLLVSKDSKPSSLKLLMSWCNSSETGGA